MRIQKLKVLEENPDRFNVKQTGNDGMPPSCPSHLLKFHKNPSAKKKRLSLSKLQAISHKRRLKDFNFMRKLRRSFIETAHSYLGVPYAKKYRGPSDSYYYSPLFLDCCGLVRKCVSDLQKDFGFRLGNWNQNYQFDTCPIELTED